MYKRAILSAVLLFGLQAGHALAQSGRACEMFEDSRFEGRRLGLGPGDAVSFRSGQFWNDRISSVRVARGCVLIAYSDNRMQGRSTEIDTRISSLRSIGWNDRISSAECDCGEYY